MALTEEQLRAMSPEERSNLIAELSGAKAPQQTSDEIPDEDVEAEYKSIVANAEIDPQATAPREVTWSDVLDAVKNDPLKSAKVAGQGAGKELLEMGSTAGGAVLGAPLTPVIGPAGPALGATAGNQFGRWATTKLGWRNPEESTGTVLGDAGKVAKEVGTDFGLNLLMGVGGEKIKKIFGGKSEQLVKAAQEGDVTTLAPLGTGLASKTAAGTRNLAREADDFVKSSEIFQGGKKFNLDTGKFERVAGQEPAKTTRDIADTIEQTLYGLDSSGKKVGDSLIEQRDTILDKAQQVANLYNQQTPGANLGKVAYGKIEAQMAKVKEVADRYATTPIDVLDDAEKQIVETMKGLKAPFESIIVQTNGKPFTKELTVKELSAQLDNVYDGLRKLGKYEASRAAGGTSQIDKFGVEETINTLNSAANAIRASRDTALREVFDKAGSNQALQGMSYDRFKDLNKWTHNLLTVKESYNAHLEDLMKRQSGAFIKEQIPREMENNFSKTGAIDAAKAIPNALTGQNPGTYIRDAQGVALNQMQQIDNASKGLVPNSTAMDMTRNTLANFGKAMSSPVGLTAGTRLRQTNPIYNQQLEFQQQSIMNGDERSPAPKIPRTIEGITQYKDYLIEQASALDPQVGQQVSQYLTASTPDRNAALGSLLKNFPELNDLFESSTFPSEINGKIQSMDDLASAARMIEDADTSDTEKALATQDLWKNKRYKPLGQPVANQGAS